MKTIQTAGKTVILNQGNCPTNCRLWNPNADDENKFNFSYVKELWDDSHDQFRLYRCETCGTEYLWHWHEEIGWDDANDSVSICTKKITDADNVVLKYFEENSPRNSAYRNFLYARMFES